jgi:cytosine/adenosine deaminase-related metal-dependent hydrolase
MYTRFAVSGEARLELSTFLSISAKMLSWSTLSALVVQVTISSASAGSSTLMSGGAIVAYDISTESLKVIRNGSLLVTGDRITGIYDAGNVPSLPSDTKKMDVTGKIISPGFIDTHKHGWQTAFKTLASNTTLPEYFLRYGEYATAGLLTADDVYLGELVGIYEALNSGTTTILDHAHHTWSNATSEAGLQACIDSGARVFWAHAFHNVTNYTIEDQVPVFRYLAEKAAFKNTPTSLAIAFDSVGATPPNLAEHKAIMGLANEFNVSVITSHFVGGPWGSV